VDCKVCIFGIAVDCFIEVRYFLTKSVFRGNKLCTCTEIDFLTDFLRPKCSRLYFNGIYTHAQTRGLSDKYSELGIMRLKPYDTSTFRTGWLQIQMSWVRFPALPDFMTSSESGTGYTQPREDN
jgi:hypothetical protein